MPGNVNLSSHLENSGDGNPRSLLFTSMDATASEAFHDANLLWDSGAIAKKQLVAGTGSHDFPIFGESPEEPEHHQRGQYIEGGTQVNTKVNIAIDDPLIKAQRLPMVDLDLSMWNLVEPTVRENNRKLAEMLDRRAFVIGLKAARTAAVSNVHPGGNVVTRTSSASLAAGYAVSNAGAQNFLDDAAQLAELMDRDNVPRAGRVMYVDPYIVRVLTRSDKLMSRDYVPGGVTMLHTRTVGIAEDFQIIPTLHLPSTNITTDLAKYNGDFSNVTGLPAALALYTGGPRSAIGAVQMGGLRNTVTFDEDHEVWLVKSRIHVGMDELEPWCAGEIRVKA